MTPYSKLHKTLASASHLKWIDRSGIEQQIKLTPNHKILYSWLYNEFHLLRQTNKRITFSNDWIAANTDISKRTVVSILQAFKAAGVVVTAPHTYKKGGTYNVTEYLHVISLVDSNKHKLVSEKLQAWYKSHPKQHKTQWTPEQCKQYQDNEGRIKASEGRYMTNEEKERAHIAPLVGMMFKLE